MPASGGTRHARPGNSRASGNNTLQGITPHFNSRPGSSLPGRLERLYQLARDNADLAAYLGICPAVGGSSGDVMADRRWLPLETHGRLATPEERSPIDTERSLWRRKAWRCIRSRASHGNAVEQIHHGQAYRAVLRSSHPFVRELGWSGIPRVVGLRPEAILYSSPSAAPLWGLQQERAL